MKQANLSIQTAKALYTQGGAARLFALDNYSEKELTEIKFPEKWEDLEEVNGFYVSSYSSVGKGTPPTCREVKRQNKNFTPYKEQAEAFLALAQLYQLHKEYLRLEEENGLAAISDNWMSAVVLQNKGFCLQKIADVFSDNFKFTFAEYKTAEHFLNNHSELLNKTIPLFKKHNENI